MGLVFALKIFIFSNNHANKYVEMENYLIYNAMMEIYIMMMDVHQNVKFKRTILVDMVIKHLQVFVDFKG